ncbi:MAG TPA: bifunctional [glutamine synthetase] adenylyltransferase/[glutamine synthetase]-adenylyl-L-tyrosine phosphorylase [Streptosporangiaceae bacterium]
MQQPQRTSTLTGRLARLGFADGDSASVLITEAGLEADSPVLDACAAAADPDQALDGLARLLAVLPDDRRADLRAALDDDEGLRTRLTAVLGASVALGDHLVRHPADWRVLLGRDALRAPEPGQARTALLYAVDADPYAPEPVGDPGGAPNGTARLHHAYRTRVLHLAGRDLTGATTFDAVAAELADLASAAVEAALALARAEVTGDCRLAVIGLGKCGAGELNYVSDVDVVFVAEPRDPGVDEAAALAAATRLAAATMRICSQGPEAPWQVDAALRPEGKAGPLVRTLDSHLAYYRRWAKTWEFQALLKARPIAGDAELGRAYADAVAPLVWQAAGRDHFVEDVQAMRRRVEENVPGEADRQLKLGPGGLRDVEFAVQLLQLVHGRTDPKLRVAGTLDALTALGAGGYVGREDAATLAEAYRFLRGVEHLLQLHRLRRTHVVPDDQADLRRLGRALHLRTANTRTSDPVPTRTGDPARTGTGDSAPARTSDPARTRTADPASRTGDPAHARTGDSAQSRTGDPASTRTGDPAQSRTGDPAAAFVAAWRRQAREVRRIHEKLFYRPLLRAVAQLPGDEARLTTEDARVRLEALGYTDPAGALGHIQALTSGVTRRAAIQRTLLPVLLGWFADAADPDAGLLGFRRVSDALGTTPWYLRLLRDDDAVARRLARVLASSSYATELLLRAPEAVAMLSSDTELAPRDRTALTAEAVAAARRHDDPAAAVAAVRSLRRRELLRTAVADLLNRLSVTETGNALTAVSAATITAALDVATRTITPPATTSTTPPATSSGDASSAPPPTPPGDASAAPPATSPGGAPGTPSTPAPPRTGLPMRMAVIGMGRFGGHETGYGSDADVMFVYEPEPGADDEEAARTARAVAEETRRLLALPAPDPPLHLDADLRPEGRQGPLTRSLASYAAYYDRWSAPWESQALIRAEPVAGDPDLGARFTELIDAYRWPAHELTDAELIHIRRLKARMEAERLPRGADPATHTKLGPGGLSDVEWTVQLLQLRHAHTIPEMRTTRTLTALDAATSAGLIDPADAEILSDAWRLATRIRGGIMLTRGKAGDSIPANLRERARLAGAIGYDPADVQHMIEDYLRATRRARTVMERLFYDG